MDRNPEQVAFYRSGAWEATRDAYMETMHHVCERCGGPAKIVHHKRYIDAANVHDVDVTLNFDNLECLCQRCHNAEHFGGRAATMPGLRFDQDGNLTTAET